MKRITCKQMGGPCDTAFEAETSGDIADIATRHIEEMAQTDPKHQEFYEEMAVIAADPERHEAWKQGFRQMFDAAPSL